MSTVNLAEVVSYLTYAGMPSDEISAMLTPLPIVMVDADVELGLDGGTLPRKTTAEAGLSLGDRFCLALAAREGLPAWTADRQWRSVSDRVELRSYSSASKSFDEFHFLRRGL